MSPEDALEAPRFSPTDMMSNVKEKEKKTVKRVKIRKCEKIKIDTHNTCMYTHTALLCCMSSHPVCAVWSVAWTIFYFKKV